MASQRSTVFADPPIAQFLFSNPKLAWLWLPLRLWVGWQWWEAGSHKIINPAWMQTGEAIRGFWERAVVMPEGGRAPVAYDWYRGFLELLLEGQHQTWFGPLVAVGETVIGIALILGAFTGIAAFFGMFMNWHFIMAGTASTNAMLMMVAMLLVMAWKTAGWIGLDRWLLPLVGTPWQPGAPLPHAGATPRAQQAQEGSAPG